MSAAFTGLFAALASLAPAQDKPADFPALPGAAAPTQNEAYAERYRRLEAAPDGWPSEAFQDAAGAQLGAIGKLLAHPEEIDAAQVAKFAASDYRSKALHASTGEVAFRSDAVTVIRGVPADTDHRGVEGFAAALADLATAFDGAHDVEGKFKIIGVELGEGEAKTHSYFLSRAHSDTAAITVNGTWTCRWKLGAQGEPPKLLGIEVRDCEMARGPAGGGYLFEDFTGSAFAKVPAWRDQLLWSVDHWCARLDLNLGISTIGHEGFAVGDVNGDDLDDLYVCQPGGLPNRLFVQQPDGSLLDVSAEAGVDWLDPSRAALLCDFDDDGDQDLVLSLGEELLFQKNESQGGKVRFERAAVVHAPATSSLAAADIDRDGDLDLYACGYMLPDSEDRVPIPYHDANNGYPNLLLRNDGGWKFTDATREVGLDQNNRRFSFACAFEDYDNDGDQDLYVANDFGRKNLYKNDGGRFRDVAKEAGAEDISAGMGVSWGDYDQDGWMDIYTSNMFSSAGERVTTQKQFKPALDGENRSHFQRHARGNTLFKNLGNGTFADVSEQANVTMGRWAWGAMFLDYDNDGRADIYVPNGFVTEEDPKDL